MVFKQLSNWLKNCCGGSSAERDVAASVRETTSEAPAVRSTMVLPPSTPGEPRHFGDLWNVLQDIAQEESPEIFNKKMVTDHAAESLEGKKDVDRWLQVYLNRTVEDHNYRFPEHHKRYQGYCLIPRHWPNGVLWEAYDDDTLLKVQVGPERTREELIAAIDRLAGEGTQD